MRAMSEPEETEEEPPKKPRKKKKRAGETAGDGPETRAAEADPPSPGAEPAAGPRPLPARFAYPLAVLCGFLYFLAFPGVDVWPLAFVALAPLIVALRGQTPRRALGLGW